MNRAVCWRWGWFRSGLVYVFDLLSVSCFRRYQCILLIKKNDFAEILFPKAPLTQEKFRAAKPVKPTWGEEPCVVTDSPFRACFCHLVSDTHMRHLSVAVTWKRFCLCKGGGCSLQAEMVAQSNQEDILTSVSKYFRGCYEPYFLSRPTHTDTKDGELGAWKMKRYGQGFRDHGRDGSWISFLWFLEIMTFYPCCIHDDNVAILARMKIF